MDKKALFQSGITKREKKSSRPYLYFHVELEQMKRKKSGNEDNQYGSL